jgi:hypothetical protein
VGRSALSFVPIEQVWASTLWLDTSSLSITFTRYGLNMSTYLSLISYAHAHSILGVVLH